ncbi:unnamed protein product [Fraxinus pennsylvanica]|uniref:Uncharacterized protein n=1 Tax=Fraxinus pennsylvanica TaxID=56036 RepID=A0AAD2E2D7_9LAMI|nr:unnamed protein product [Fraxinus pennsylvanica]
MSETRRADSVTVKIDNILDNLSSTPSKPSMFRVAHHLRSINPEAYDPQIIAIGPFHRSKPNLQKMEQHKVRYLKLFLQRRKESSVERYVTTIRHLEDRARKCYAEDIQLDEDKFVQMLILDGCFIVEFLYMYQHRKCRDKDDPIFQYEHIKSQLLHDLMVFENQIPFFIIDHLFRTIKINNEDNVNSLIWPLLRNGIFPAEVKVSDLFDAPINGHHLLGIVHHFQCSSFADRLSYRILPHRDPEYLHNIDSAAELEKAGISFQKSESDSLFHIEFENKVMKIPKWKISFSTESLFRNVIAYEHYNTDSPRKYVTDYVFFMHCLVHSPEDAKVLQRSRIIINFLRSNEMVYRVINQLGKNIMTSVQFPYSNIFSSANDHCARRGNRWMATLKQEYFNNPWTTSSVFAAIVLLVLTIIQATFAILSYRNDLKKGN